MIFIVKKTNRKKYPEKIKFSDKLRVLVPDQYSFSDSYIRDHGCSLTAFYMALRFCGKKKSVKWCLKYLKKHYGLNGRSKYSLWQIYDAILTLCPGQNFYENPTKSQIKKHLKAGRMIIFEERKPAHTAVYLWNGRKIIRFSNGGHRIVTLNQIMSKRNTDSYYKGCAVIRR